MKDKYIIKDSKGNEIPINKIETNVFEPPSLFKRGFEVYTITFPAQETGETITINEIL
jgi:hypothetical protein